MSKKIKSESFTEAIDDAYSVVNESIIMPIGKLERMLKSPHSISRIQNFEYKFLDYLFKITGVSLVSLPHQYLTIVFDENFKYRLTISPFGFLSHISLLLGCGAKPPEDGKEILQKIEELSEIDNETELNEKFPNLYKNWKNANEESKKNRAFMLAYMSSKNDASKLKKIKKNYGLSSFSDEEIEKSCSAMKMAASFNLYMEGITKFFREIVRHFHDIRNWVDENSFELQLSYDDMKTILLYSIFIQIKNLELNAINDSKSSSQFIFFEAKKMINNYIAKYPYDESIVEFENSPLSEYDKIGDHRSEMVQYSIKKAISDLEQISKEYPYLRQDIILPTIDKSLTYEENINNIYNYINKMLDEAIAEDQEHGAKDATEEVHQKLEQLEEDLKSYTLSDKEIKEKAIVLKKLNMVLNDIKPKAIQTGTGKIFRDYYVYYYDNGMVAVDRVDGYGALYIMPVNIYKVARYKNLLGDVKNIPGVKSVSHKNKDWLNIAKNYIMTGTDGLTEKDMKEAEEVASIDFPYTLDGLEKLQKQLEEAGNFTEGISKETKRRAKKIKEMADIDKELKDNEFDDYSDMPEEKRQLLEILDGAQAEVLYSDEIDQVVSSDKSFDELYEDWKKNNEVKKKTRNPVVAGTTKRRAMVDNNYSCEWCGSQPSYSSGVHSHHIKALSKGGVDNIYNTVCVCPSCHAYFHSGESKPIDDYRLLMITKEHIIQENPEYLPQFNELLNGMFKPEEQEKFDEFYTYEWNYINYKTK